MDVVESVKRSLAAVADRANFILNSVNYAISHLSQFSESMKKLVDTQQMLVGVLQQILVARRDLARDPAAPITIPKLPGDDMLPLHISAAQKDSYFPPVVTMDAILVKFQNTHKTFYEGDVFKTYPEIKNPTSSLLKNIQKDFLKSITDGSLFLENYVSTMTALRDDKSQPEDRDDVISDLSNLVSISSWTAFQVIPSEITSILDSYRAGFSDSKYDAYFQDLLQLINVLFTSKTGDGILGTFWKDSQNVVDAFTAANSFWTNDTAVLTDIVNPNIPLWSAKKDEIDKFREGIAAFVF